MVFPCNEIKKTAWEVLQNFDHALVLREDDPLLPAILGVYEKQGIKDGAPSNLQKGPAFKTELATAYPECHLVVTKETMTVEGMIKIVYDLLKDKLNIVKITFTSGVNVATQEYGQEYSKESTKEHISHRRQQNLRIFLIFFIKKCFVAVCP